MTDFADFLQEMLGISEYFMISEMKKEEYPKKTYPKKTIEIHFVVCSLPRYVKDKA